MAKEIAEDPELLKLQQLAVETGTAGDGL